LSVHLLLYDGVCGLCHGLVGFVLRHDEAAMYDFASLQSEAADAVLRRFERKTSDVKTFYVVKDYRSPSAQLLSKSEAALFVLASLGGGWRGVAAVLRLCPRVIGDSVYDLVARVRYRVFGRYDSCPLPPPDVRARFLDR
jgi:predicted DCC family thiol-disulfide oxidoreductase YuxK